MKLRGRLNLLRHAIDHRVVVGVVSHNNVNALILPPVMRVDPLAKSRQRRGDGGHAERKAFERRVAPRLVIRRKHREVEPHQQVVVGRIEYAVVAVQVRGHKKQLHLILWRVIKLMMPAAMEYRIVFAVIQVMREMALVDIAPVGGMLQVIEQFFVRAVVVAGHHDERQHFFLQQVVPVELRQRVDENVDTFVPVFVPSAEAYQQGVVRHRPVEQRLGHAAQLFASGVLLGRQLGGRRRKTVLKAVGRDEIALFGKKMFTFAGGDVAHRSEAVGGLRGRPFQREARHHVEAARRVVGVIAFHVVVERQVVSGDAAPQHGGMGGEHTSDLRHVHLQVEQAGAGHPLVELRHHAVAGVDVEVGETLNHLSGGVAEERRLDVIPLSVDRVEVIHFPEFRKYLVFFRDERRKIDQHGYRMPGHIPASHPDAQPFLCRLRAPRPEQAGVFLKVGIPFGVAPHVGANQDVVILPVFLHIERLRGHHRVDASYLVTNFPTRFK